MSKTKLPLFFSILLFSSLFVSQANASLVIALGTFGTNFSSSGIFNGDMSGSSDTFTSSASTVVLTTTAVSNSLSEGSETANGSLGVDSGTGDADRFDGNESWTFAFDTAGTLTDIDFGLFTPSGAEQFTVTSDSLGTLVFTNSGNFDVFGGTDSAGTSFGSTVIGAGEQITFTYSSTDAGNAVIEGFVFDAITTAVPEPSTSLMFGTALIGLAYRRRRR